MDFALSPTHEMTRKMVREFAERDIRPESRKYDESQEYPIAWARRMGELGLLGVAVPEKYGGAGLDSVCYAITIEELSWGDASAGVIAAVNNGLVCEPILAFGTEAQKQAYLPRLASGEWMGAYCLTEPGSGSDAAAMRTTAKLEGDDWVLNGTKIFVTNALHANLLVVYARTGAQKHDISAFLVPKPLRGLTDLKKEDKMGIRASDTMMLGFEDVRIPRENLLGTQGKGFNIALATLDGGRIGIAAQALGIAQAAHDEAARYAKEREAFGQPIVNFQAIQFKIADMAMEIDAARLLTYRVAWLHDQGVRHTYE
ncbi:MAG: acyl-CoA dehydrogenase family protein, partial [Thermoplasmata archaeon]